MTLLEFLLARIADDECLARMAFGDHNDNGPDWDEPWSGAVDLKSADQEFLLTNDSGVSRHIVNWAPARVLAECEAKRRVIARIQMSQMLPAQISAHAAAAILRDLALPYVDHPDYLLPAKASKAN